MASCFERAASGLYILVVLLIKFSTISCNFPRSFPPPFLYLYRNFLFMYSAFKLVYFIPYVSLCYFDLFYYYTVRL